jgi:hypothetical protein
MRVSSLLVLVLLGGCSILDSIESGMNGPFGYDPSKIYLDDSVIMVSMRDVDNYACLGRPMLCERFGSKMECRCPH